MSSIISVKNIMFSYISGINVLNNINLEVSKGETVAIIGHNGSGKTTLVKHFNGLLKPTSGDVLINDVSVMNRTTAQLSRTVGYVFQNPDDQIFNNTVYTEVAFGPKNLGLSKVEIRRRVRDALEFVGLLGVKNIHPLDLNLNDKKLVTIASIIAMNPEVIILDEPSSGQDHEGVRRVELLIKALSRNHTVILISHDMSLVSRVASRIVMMFDSRIIFDGSVRDAFTRTDLLKKTDLSPPVITELAQKIKGFRKDVLTINEFTEEIIKLRKKRIISEYKSRVSRLH